MSDELQSLDPAACLALIERVAVGRIAWAEDDGTVTVFAVQLAFAVAGTVTDLATISDW